MKRQKAFILAILIFSSLLSAAGCGADSLAGIYDDTAKLLQNGDSYSFKSITGDTDKQKSSFSFSRFSGVRTIWIIDIPEEGELKLDFDVSKISGQFKLVIAGPDDQLLTIDVTGGKGSWSASAKGQYRVKMVGKASGGQMSVSLAVPQGSTVTVPE